MDARNQGRQFFDGFGRGDFHSLYVGFVHKCLRFRICNDYIWAGTAFPDQCYVVSFDISDDEVVPSPVELALHEVRVVPVCGGYLAIGAVLNTLYSHPVGDDEGIFQIRCRP